MDAGLAQQVSAVCKEIVLHLKWLDTVGKSTHSQDIAHNNSNLNSSKAALLAAQGLKEYVSNSESGPWPSLLQEIDKLELFLSNQVISSPPLSPEQVKAVKFELAERLKSLFALSKERNKQQEVAEGEDPDLRQHKQKCLDLLEILTNAIQRQDRTVWKEAARYLSVIYVLFPLISLIHPSFISSHVFVTLFRTCY